MATTTDWSDWHEAYANPGSPLSRRLRLVRRHVGGWLDGRPGESLTAVSVCAGQGHDLLGVLTGRADAHRVRATLIEADERNVAAARLAAATLPTVSVLQGDAGELAAYDGAVPADLVLMAGVFGNISDADSLRTIRALPRLCASGATVIWTRSRRAPDPTPTLRSWLADAGFVEDAFHAPDSQLFTVGVHHFTGAPLPLSPPGRLFTFTT